ncbi:hypothetical protein QFC22_002948 [Naganishia vaughanmartiniae]|uniref:Uncharacterized protein n=1 Tax=Naganishia vaughanmartiniae TaxID=1424756 RepID=A0ACC2X8U1_9TREE|nr:hypothetical protein QFC22_002948 [Naganishia vaughanmartiniae]
MELAVLGLRPTRENCGISEDLWTTDESIQQRMNVWIKITKLTEKVLAGDQIAENKEEDTIPGDSNIITPPTSPVNWDRFPSLSPLPPIRHANPAILELIRLREEKDERREHLRVEEMTDPWMAPNGSTPL